MEWRRWTWRLAAAAPAVLLAGLTSAGLTSAGTVQATGLIPCPTPSPTPTSLLPSVTSKACQTVQKVTGPVSRVTGTVSKAVHGGTSGSSGSTSSGQTAAAGGSAASGSQGQQSHSAAQRHAQRAGATSPAAAAIPPPTVGAYSPIGIPGWLLVGNMGGLTTRSVPLALNLPEVHPAAQRAAQAAKHARKAPDRMWLVIVLGAVGLVGGAGEHFLGWPGLRRRARTAT